MGIIYEKIQRENGYGNLLCSCGKIKRCSGNDGKLEKE
jgi:hypothetical protein